MGLTRFGDIKDGLVDRFFAATDDFKLQNSAGYYGVLKFQMQSMGCQDVFLDGMSTPSTAINPNIDRRQTLEIEPTSSDGIKTLLERMDGVSRISCGDN